jgi:hypothetical protein
MGRTGKRKKRTFCNVSELQKVSVTKEKEDQPDYRRLKNMTAKCNA